MKKEIIRKIVSILNTRGFVNFYLHNVIYTIILKNNVFLIKQSGCDTVLKFDKITDLFQTYRIYGDSLIESLEDIILK